MIEYKLKRKKERIGEFEIELDCLDNLDETIDSLFEMLKKDGRESLLEELCPYFGIVWPSARALATYVVQRGEKDFNGKSVLEVGCGLAVPSLIAARLGAHVTATDFHPEVPRFLERNVRLNHVTNIEYLPLAWQRDHLQLKAYDWIIGSDVLYERQQPPQLAAVIAQHLSPGGTAVVADPARPYLQEFHDEMLKHGFKAETSILKVHDLPVDKEIFLLEFRKG